MECNCGCGKPLISVDKRKRPVRYLNGHRRKLLREEHPGWKEKISYSGIHKYVVREFGRADFCEQCGEKDPKRKYEWANISHNYTRDRNDWKKLCHPCHIKFDGNDKFYKSSPKYQKYLERNLFI